MDHEDRHTHHKTKQKPQKKKKKTNNSQIRTLRNKRTREAETPYKQTTQRSTTENNRQHTSKTQNKTQITKLTKRQIHVYETAQVAQGVGDPACQLVAAQRPMQAKHVAVGSV